MIFEHTAIHTPTQGLTISRKGVRPSVVFEDAVEAPGIPSIGSRTRLWVTSMTVGLWRVLTARCRPSFFELELRSPEHRRLGPGVSRVSDSFWPLVEW